MEIRDIQTGSIDYNGHTIYFPTTDEPSYIVYNGFTYYYNDSYLLEKSDNRVKDKYLKRVTRTVFRDIQTNEVWQFTEPLPYLDGLYRQSRKLVNVTRDIEHRIPDYEIDVKEVASVKELFIFKKIHGIDKQTCINNLRNKLQDKLTCFITIVGIIFMFCMSFACLYKLSMPFIECIWFLPCFVALWAVIYIKTVEFLIDHSLV